MKEVFYAYEQTRLKEDAGADPAGIEQGDWKAIDLEAAGQRKRIFF